MSWIPPGFQSLKVRAMVVILSIVLLTVGALALIVSAVLRAELETLLANQQSATVSMVASAINYEFSERTKALELVAARVDATIMAHPAQAQALLNDRAVLKILFNAGYFLTNVDGFAIAEYPLIGRVGLNYLDRDHVASALKSGKAMIGRPVVGKTVKAPSFAMTIPLRDAQGKIIGALTGATDLTKPNFLDSVDAANYGRTGGYLIVDSGHRLFVTATQNNKNLVMQPLPEPGVNRVLDQRLLGFDGSAVNINSLGKEVLTTSGRIPAAGWFVISTLPTEEAFEPIRQINLHLYEAAGLASLLAICIAWWSMSRLLSPLQKAAQDVSLLAEEGASNTDLPIARMDEVGKLIDGFNRVMRVSTAREKALRESENQIRQLAFHDALTQLPNRRLMIDRLEQAMLAGKRTGKYCALMFIDLDNFKPLNDTYGHETGDQMLVQAAQRLTACVRAIDTVARFGGDEFVLLISDLAVDYADTERQASEIAEKIRQAMAEPYGLEVAHGNAQSAVVSHVSTVSMGVALFKGGELAVDDVLHRADTAMYQAKMNGRNLVRFHQSGVVKTAASIPKSCIDTSIDLPPPAAPT